MKSYYIQTKAQLDKTLNSTTKDVYLLILAAIGGTAIGTMVAGIRVSVGFIQSWLFGADLNLPNILSIPGWRIMLVTCMGSLLLGFMLLIAARFKRLAIIDPIEANALFGGRMSLLDSLILVSLSALSITIGGAVGFEAAMTQLGAGCLSFVGQRLKFERRDLRLLVACGTGAGLTAIFGAPLAGAFYALELVVGGYALRALMPTLLASAMSGLIIYLLLGYQPIFPANINELPSLWHVPLAIMIGFIAALIGITVMRGTTGFEHLLKQSKLPLWLKPAIGGLLLGLIALQQPLVMGPSHSGINLVMSGGDSIGNSTGMLLAKIIAAIVCVGSGFRGGLFSASLLLGATLGYILHGLVVMPLFGNSIALDLTVVAGMAGVATSIIGTPVAIVLLMVETAGLHSGVITSVITVIIASYFTKRWFGYSFSTWRFHIRGSNLEGPRDIARLRELTFANLPLATTPPTTTNTPALTVCATTCLDDYLTLAKTSHAHQIAVLNEQGLLLGYTSQTAILQRYLTELLRADHDERA